MISHTFTGVRDFSKALAFYSALMNELGLELKFNDAENSWAGWMKPGLQRPLFLIGLPHNGKPAQSGNGQMIALLAENRATVDQVYAIAIKNGGLCEGQPGLRPHYHEHYYGAYFRDLDGNKLCVCCHEAY